MTSSTAPAGQLTYVAWDDGMSVEVHAPDHSISRDRDVGLAQIEGMTHGFRESPALEPLEEDATLDGVLGGVDPTGTLDAQGNDLHGCQTRGVAGGASKQRWLVVGAGGMLGRDSVDVLSASGQAVTAATYADLDIGDTDACTGAVPGHDIVVNATAWTAVHDAEPTRATLSP